MTTAAAPALYIRIAVWLIVAATPPVAGAQSDYYNTDRNRPIRIEDAYATERYAFDAHLAPIRLERAAGGVYSWQIDPEVAYGILPRTQLEVGLPVAFVDAGGSRRRVGFAGLDVSVLHNLNTETVSLPAFAVRASVVAPVGSLAPQRAYASLQGILTRTFTRARVHVNAAYTFGDAAAADRLSTVAPPAAGETSEISRWLAGVALDRAFPLRSLLVTGETYATRPLLTGEDVEWNAGAGLRFQVGPHFALDGGVGKRLTGGDRAWYVTFGVARVFALRALMPHR